MSAVSHVLRVAVGVLMATVLAAGAVTGAALAAVRLQAAAPALTPSVASSATWAAAPGAPSTIAPPDQGSLAIAAVDGSTVRQLLSVDAQTVRPIASVAKTMTALVVLEVHPLLPDQMGPTLTMTQQDVDDYHRIASSGGSFAPVSLGERLTERDLLIGLMLPSANNLALTAARWIDGSVGAFVHRLNTRAAALGMHHTHFADPAGLDPATTSTAADLLALGVVAVGDDSLISVVSTISATLPDGTTVQNLDILLGQQPGWLGVKTGWTPAAGGCLLFAARRSLSPGTPPLTIVGAVLDQPRDGNVDLANPELGGAFSVASASVDSAFKSFVEVRVGRRSIPVSGQVFGPWGAYCAVQPTGPDRFVLLRAGESLSVATTTTVVAVPADPGARVGSVTVSLKGAPIGTWTLATTGRLDAPAPWWRLLHG